MSEGSRSMLHGASPEEKSRRTRQMRSALCERCTFLPCMHAACCAYHVVITVHILPIPIDFDPWPKARARVCVLRHLIVTPSTRNYHKNGREICGVRCARGIVVPTVVLAHLPCFILHGSHAMSAAPILRMGHQHQHYVIQLYAVSIQYSRTHLHCNSLDSGCRSGPSLDSQC